MAITSSVAATTAAAAAASTAAAAGGAAAAGAGAATLASAAATGLFSSTTMGVLSALSTGLAAITGIAGHIQQGKQAKFAAREAEVQAEAEELRGMQEGNEIRRQLIRDQSEIIAQGGNSGRPIAQLTAGVANRAGRAMNVVDFNSKLEARRQSAQAAYYRRSKPGVLDYAGTIAGAAQPMITRALER